ncbi:hypothetical protein [Paracoccus pacificus]|uniref:Sulfotransferase family protein n=1 Tax=Paracoccus pacificus TaxID=1463598 RepID=A0ABW4R5W0_9RHOB
MHKRLFCIHMKHMTAGALDVELMAVLRNPFDRILSLYSYRHQVDNGPETVRAMSFDGSLDTRRPRFSQDKDNAQIWQLAFGHINVERRNHTYISEDSCCERPSRTYLVLPRSALTIEQRRRIFARTEIDPALYEHVVGLVRSGHTTNPIEST